jgi:type IV pilus assembly protein PilC
MITFNYIARDKDGELQKGQVESDTEFSAAKILTSRHLFPISISVKEKNSFDIFNRISIKDKAIFIRQFATTLAAGLPITQALQTINEQMNNKNLSNIIAQIVSDVEGGMALSASFSRFPKLFSRIDIALVAAGESSGTLDKVLIRLADTIEKDYKILKKVRSAMSYPAFILLVVIGVLILMTVYVMPQMEGLFKDFNADLPAITQGMLAFSHFLSKFGVLVLAAIIGLGFLFRYFIHTKTGRLYWDTVRLQLPIIGPFLRSVYSSRFSRTMAGLVGSGVSLLDALNITSGAVGNVVIYDVIFDAAQKVKGGTPLSKPIKDSGEFPPIVPQMIRVGEQTGEMDKMLTNLADYFDDEVDNFIKSITSIIEPAIIVVMGGVVAIMLIAIMMPIYSIGKIF